MNKAFVREDAGDDEDDLPEGAAPLPPGSKNYITPAGYERLCSELMHLIDTERPEVVGIVSWAASNGDRSENGDYLYGKKRLREIDRRIRFLTRRIEKAEVVDASLQGDNDQIFFGATVTYANQAGGETTITIVGMDEVDLDKGYVSWISPIARALIKAREGDTVPLRTPAGVEQIDILAVKYPPRAA
ncbi:transcription elongation factor GreB [Ralstonia insidiosa]|jgi:transcription elongation factor GreB|uniref:transcription elongation factor GreB n=1 Tax=Ralstonia TaxID=48736 RepID=UPI000664B3E3|nr:transcription elongation factor GreB [Ralstonia insidiosa]KMW44185.1 transcription elongation factor GreB [Ralstonia sp. MD27]MBX3775597.1 transcription elongation factor GreB [Ralstonia pickettii]NOZ17773.1 transcription elongation factor GreB [Betaproteobacteria bacterium]MBA9859723.1 transcription elongation factor GreB [Ralstonia insidiosa]MBA9873437.1 transcription elongation factor GreB [Ralstonia insidiosa]